MIENKVSDLEAKLISKTREFVSELNNKRPKKSREYLIKMEEHKKRNRITIGISRGNFLLNHVAYMTYWNNADGEGKIFFSGNIIKEKYSAIKDEYRKFILKEIPEIADRIKY
jgi:hypothetical protein